MTAFDEACQSAAALGITITVASGDNGSSDGGSGNNVDFPASSPHVLGCGGTELTAANGVIQQEIVWNDQPQGGGASGGGVSSVFPIPPGRRTPTSPAPNQRRRTRRTRRGRRCLTRDRLQRLVRWPVRSCRRDQRSRPALGRADRPAQPAARQQYRLRQSRALPERRERLQRYHPGKQRQLFGGTRLGPMHRPWLAQRKPVVADFRDSHNRRRKIGTRNRLPRGKARPCGGLVQMSDAKSRGLQVSILGPGSPAHRTAYPRLCSQRKLFAWWILSVLLRSSSVLRYNSLAGLHFYRLLKLVVSMDLDRNALL